MLKFGKLEVTSELLNEVFHSIGFQFCAVQRIPEGFVNVSYLVDTVSDGQYVLRLCNPRFGQSKVLNEVAVLQFVRQHCQIPVPSVVCYDPSAENPFGAGYMLMTRIPGRTLRAVYDQLTASQIKTILCEVAAYFGQLWEFSFPEIGCFAMDMSPVPIFKAGYGPFSDAASFLSEELNYRAQKLFSQNLYLEYSDAVNRFNERVVKLSPNCEFVLIHQDMNFNNILIGSDHHVSGIVDWEWSMSSPVMLDITTCDFYQDPNLRDIFLSECSKFGTKFLENYTQIPKDVFTVLDHIRTLRFCHDPAQKDNWTEATRLAVKNELGGILKKHSC